VSGTLFDLLRRSAACYGPSPALAIRRGLRTDRWTYAELLASVEDATSRLRTRGIGPGDRILVMAANSPELVASMFAAWKLEAILVPIDLRTSPEVIAAMIRQVEPRCSIADDPAATPGVPALAPSALVGAADIPANWAPLPPSPIWDGAPADLAEIVFTSGTTGNPKGVMLTHANILINVEAAVDTLATPLGTRVLSLMPLSHMMEQTAGLLAALRVGGTVYYATSRRSSAILEAMQRHRIELMVCVPEVLRLMLAGIEREVERRGRQRAWARAHALAPRLPFAARRLLFRAVRRRLGGHLKVILSGGAPLGTDLWGTWERLGVRVVQGYGATECSPIVASHRLHRRLPNSVGWPVRGVEVRLGDGGEVHVRGASVTPGYWMDEARTAEALADGWYRTGDVGVFGPAGDLRLQGRARDMIVLADGRNVFPEDVEAALREEPAIRDCTVVGRPRPDGSTEVHAVVIPAADTPPASDAGSTHGDGPTGSDSLAIEAALRRANGRLGPHQQVRGFTRWPAPDFPRTPSLKVKRAAVLAALAGTPVPADTPATVESGVSTAERIVAMLARLGGKPAASLTPDSDLSLDAGLDSLGRVELAVLLEEELGCYLADDTIAGLRTVGDLTAAVARGNSGRASELLPAWPRQPAARALRNILQQGLLFPAVRAYCRPLTVVGGETFAILRGPTLLVANHASHLDSALVLATLPSSLRRRTSVAAAADYFFSSRARSLAAIGLINAFPFERHGAVGASLAHCGDLADDGESVLIFPEGTRSATGALAPLKTGIGLLARELRVPVVPLYLDGPFRILPKGRTWPARASTRVIVGTPIRFDATVSPRAATDQIEAALRGLSTRSTPPT